MAKINVFLREIKVEDNNNFSISFVDEAGQVYSRSYAVDNALDRKDFIDLKTLIEFVLGANESNFKKWIVKVAELKIPIEILTAGRSDYIRSVLPLDDEQKTLIRKELLLDKENVAVDERKSLIGLSYEELRKVLKNKRLSKKNNSLKGLVYLDKLFGNARSFYEYISEVIFKGDEPVSWSLNYVAQCFSKRLKTISGFKVDWVTISIEEVDKLQQSEKGWIKWTEGGDKTFEEFVLNQEEPFTKETLWNWVIDYVITYDIPRSKMNVLTAEVLKNSIVIGKKNNINLYRLLVK